MTNREDSEYLDAISRFICDARLTHLPARVIERCRWVIADSLPVIATGMQVTEMKLLSANYLASAAPGNAWVIGTGKRASAADAALLNGTAGGWHELNEGSTGAKGHPGIQVVPAAVAFAQETGACGSEVLLAVALGYEVSSRISRAAKTRFAVHPHGTWGTIGAAIAAGRLKAFSQPQMRQLINVAATMGLATSRNTLLEGATVRNIYTGHSGFMGLMAVRLVESGFIGEADGVKSIYGSVIADGFSPEVVVADLGHEWMVGDGYFKLHPTGRGVHSAIDALEAALAKAPGGRIDTQNVERIEVRTYNVSASPAALLCGKVTNSFGAKFSIPFALGTLMHHGRSGVDCFDDAAVANPKVQALAARVQVQEEPAFTAAYPRQQNCSVKIVLNSGTAFEGRCTVMKGEPGNPHRTEELEKKFFELGATVWGMAVARRLYDGCMALEDIPDFREFTAELSL